jgi:hypothetical protein
MSDEGVFARDGEQFVPGPHAIGPWAKDRLHGGPVIGLIARAVERAQPDPELVLARLSVDMFRPVPAAPLAVRLETLRKGSRLTLLRASVLGGDGAELAQGTALLLRASDAAASEASVAPPPGPAELATESIMRNAPRDPNRPRGFHTRVETRWVPRQPEERVAIWFRLPIPLVAGEPTSSLVNALALSDFANAVPSIAASARHTNVTSYINADTTIYLARRPRGEWFCLREHAQIEAAGISTAQVELFDQHGLLGHALQARLAVR